MTDLQDNAKSLWKFDLFLKTVRIGYLVIMENIMKYLKPVDWQFVWLLIYGLLLWLIIYYLIGLYFIIDQDLRVMISIIASSTISLLIFVWYNQKKTEKKLKLIDNIFREWRYVDALIEYSKSNYKFNRRFFLYNSWLCLENLECYEEAILYYDDVISTNPSYIDVYFRKFNCLEKMKQYDDALACIEKCIALNDKNPESYYLKWRLLNNLNRPKEAIDSFEQWLALDNQNNDITFAIYFLLYSLYRNALMDDKAIELCDRAIKNIPNRQIFYIYKASLLYNDYSDQKNMQLWFDTLLLWLDNNPIENKEIYETMLSFIINDKYYISKSKKLIHFYNSYITKYYSIQNKIHYMIWGECFQYENEFQQALDIYQSIEVKDLPSGAHYLYYNNIWYSYTKKNDYRNAYNYFKKAIKAKSDFAIWYYNKANAELFIWDYDHMFVSLEKALDLDNNLVKKIIDDKDFDIIRDHERYKKLIENIQLI